MKNEAMLDYARSVENPRVSNKKRQAPRPEAYRDGEPDPHRVDRVETKKNLLFLPVRLGQLPASMLGTPVVFETGIELGCLVPLICQWTSLPSLQLSVHFPSRTSQ
jgi:hypothetical protein